MIVAMTVATKIMKQLLNTQKSLHTRSTCFIEIMNHMMAKYQGMGFHSTETKSLQKSN